MIEKGTVMGIKRGVGKESKKPYTMISVAVPCYDWQTRQGWKGYTMEEFFCPSELEKSILDTDIGKEIEIEKSISGNRVYVNNFTVNRK